MRSYLLAVLIVFLGSPAGAWWQSTHEEITNFPDGTLLRWSIGGKLDDGAGHRALFGRSQLAKVPAAGGHVHDDAAIQAVWAAFKAAIRRGDDAAAMAQVSVDPNSRELYATFLRNLTPADRATIDGILPPIPFVLTYGDPAITLLAEYATDDKVTAGVPDSHPVTFILDSDGVRRIH